MVIIGDLRDPHVEVVVAHLDKAVVLDAETFASRPYWLTEDACELGDLRIGLTGQLGGGSVALLPRTGVSVSWPARTLRSLKLLNCP